MKHIHLYHLLILTSFIQVNCQYLSLLRELEMKNPVIVGNISMLKTRNMFDMMKYIMKQKQSIHLTTNIRNGSVQHSTGIVLDKNISKMLLLMNENLRKPWIIVGEFSEMYTQIDKPLYFLENGKLCEQFEFKSLKKRNELGNIQDGELLWDINQKKNFLERRGNFENLTLIGMTKAWSNAIVLPKEWRKNADLSTIVKDTYEVRYFLIYLTVHICRMQ